MLRAQGSETWTQPLCTVQPRPDSEVAAVVAAHWELWAVVKSLLLVAMQHLSGEPSQPKFWAGGMAQVGAKTQACLPPDTRVQEVSVVVLVQVSTTVLL
jgi:hypothetical protein